MKRTALLALVAIAALACTALASASSAFASDTVLCKTNESFSGSYCLNGNTYAAGTSLKASSSSVKFASSLASITCTESSLEGKTSAQKGEPLSAEFSSWTLAGCKTTSGTSCTATAQHLPYTASFVHSEGGNGSVSLKGSGGGSGWRMVCGGITNCTFTFGSSIPVEGGGSAHLSANQSMERGAPGGVCPASVSIAASYTVTSPQPLYVSAAAPPPPLGVTFCKASVSECWGPNVYPAHTSFAASLAPKTSATIATSLLNLSCKTSTLTGETTAEAGEPLPATSSYSLSECATESGTGCTMTSEGQPYSTTFGLNAFENGGTVQAKEVSLHLTCGALLNCTYLMPTARFEMAFGSPATLEISQELLVKSGLCPKTSVLKAQYNMTSPSPLYLVKDD
jgi:hypothetical protein